MPLQDKDESPSISMTLRTGLTTIKGKFIIALLTATILFVFIVFSTKHDVVVNYVNESPGLDIRQNYADKAISELELEQEKRRQMVNYVCDKNDITPHSFTSKRQNSWSSIIVDEQHKLLYCGIPKVACTNWKRVLLVLTGKMNTTNPLHIDAHFAHANISKYLRTLNKYSFQDIQHILKSYLKIMFVREPLERILSAYRNKFTTSYNKYFQKRYGREIVKRFRTNPNITSLTMGNDVQFNEFLQYVLDPKEPLNEHWSQYYKICNPCLIKYDIIGKYETFNRDSIYALQRAGISHKIKFPTKPYDHKRTVDVARSKYREIPNDIIHKLWELYAVDYAMFGYQYPDFHADG